MIEGFAFYNKTIEGYEFKPDAQPGSPDFSNNILALQEQSNAINMSDALIDANYIDLSNNIRDLSNNYTSLYGNPKYTTMDIPVDKTDKIKTTTDVRKEDINALLLQQNYIYIVGSITCATLLIAAVIIGKE
jgi:hypothetical protein